MKSKLNKKKEQSVFPFESSIDDAKIFLQTREPVISGLPIRGRLTVTESQVNFSSFLPEKHTRNKIVFSSKHFTLRITANGDFTGTFRAESVVLVDKKSRAKLMQEFINLLSSVNEGDGEPNN